MRLSPGIFRCLVFVATLSIAASAAVAKTFSDRVVAVVNGANGAVIVESEVKKYKLPFIRANFSLPLGVIPPGKWPTEREILDELVVVYLLEQEAAKKGLKMDDRGVDASVENIKKRNHLTQDQFVLFLAQNGFNYSDYRKLVKRQIVLTQLISNEVIRKVPMTEEDAQEYFKKNRDKIKEDYERLVERLTPAAPTKEPEKIEIPTHEEIYLGGKVKLKQITLKIPGNHTRKDIEATMEKAKLIYREAMTGADFSQLAKKYSQDHLAAHGGDLGLMDYKDMVPQMQKLVQRMKQGDVSPPLSSPQAIIMFQLAEAKNRTTKKVPIPEKIRKQLEQQVKEVNDRRAAQRKQGSKSVDRDSEKAEADEQGAKVKSTGILTAEEEKEYLKVRSKVIEIVRHAKIEARMKEFIEELKKNSIIEIKM